MFTLLLLGPRLFCLCFCFCFYQNNSILVSISKNSLSIFIFSSSIYVFPWRSQKFSALFSSLVLENEQSDHQLPNTFGREKHIWLPPSWDSWGDPKLSLHVQEEQPTTCVETSKRSTLRPIVPSPRPSSGAVGLCCFPAFVSPPFRTFPTYSLLWIELLLS